MANVLRMFMCVSAYQNWRTLHRWGGLVFIVDVHPVGRVTRSPSHWMECFLFYPISDLVQDIERAIYLR